MPNEKVPKNATKFFCDICDFKCCKESNYNSHLLTRKHKFLTNPNEKMPKNADKNHECECGKHYKHMSSLCNHKKNCKYLINDEPTENDDTSSDKKLIMELLKSNNELQKQIIELCKEGKTINNNTTNNNQFNLQFFLNEQCKDALNLKDFVDQIKLQLSDLDMIGRVGYVEGMSKIFLRNLKELDVCKRPIHCSDLKRETLYVKDKDAWEKENGENVKITRAIKEVEHKNIKQLPQWREENPAADDTETKKHMEYQNILLEAMGGSTLEDDNKKREKIVRNIAKEVVIDKNK
jgi:ferritin